MNQECNKYSQKCSFSECSYNSYDNTASAWYEKQSLLTASVMLSSHLRNISCGCVVVHFIEKMSSQMFCWFIYSMLTSCGHTAAFRTPHGTGRRARMNSLDHARLDDNILPLILWRHQPPPKINIANVYALIPNNYLLHECLSFFVLHVFFCFAYMEPMKSSLSFFHWYRWIFSANLFVRL